jgi:hypothetical protein
MGQKKRSAQKPTLGPTLPRPINLQTPDLLIRVDTNRQITLREHTTHLRWSASGGSRLRPDTHPWCRLARYAKGLHGSLSRLFYTLSTIFVRKEVTYGGGSGRPFVHTEAHAGALRRTPQSSQRDASTGGLLGFRALLEAQVFHAAAVAAHQLQRLDTDLDMRLDEPGRDAAVARFGLHPFRNHRLVGHQQ